MLPSSGTLPSSGMDAGPVLALLDEAVAIGVFPGATLSVGDAGTERLAHACGTLARAPHAPSATPVTLATSYDCASLTKVLATTAVAMRLVEQGLLDVDAPAHALLPELAAPGHARILLRHLLEHSSGLPWWRPFHEQLTLGERLGAPSARDALLRMCAALPLDAAPGERAVYSDPGFILLGFALERAGGARLDELAARLVFAPAGLTTARFVDLDADPRTPRPTPVAPTELCPRRGLVTGEAHDENCHAAGGITGHAGLFATVADVARLAVLFVRSHAGERVPGGFPAELVRTFFAPRGVPDSTRRLGWDGVSAARSSAGELWSRAGVGHLGFTGTSLWLDPERGRWVCLLSNRVHPSRTDERIQQLRPRLHDAVSRALGA